MALQIPLSAIPSQTLAVTLGNQPAEIAVRALGAKLYFDLRNNNTPVVLTRLCQNRQRLLVDAVYQGFIGELMFIDLQGDSPPRYSGLGTRWVLWYLEAGE